MIKDYIPLVDAIIDAFLFLECSGKDDVEPDSAVRCMESMSSSLLKLENSDQIELRAELGKIAGGAQDLAYRRFVQALPDMIGLASR